MNLFQLVFKQMRQRALSTWLTLLSVMVGVSLAVTVLTLNRAGDALFVQSDYGYDMVIGATGSRLNLVFNTVYHIGDATTVGTIPYMFYEELPRNFPREADVGGAVKWKVPVVFGDNYKGFRIVGTSSKMFGIDDTFTNENKPLPAEKTFEYRLNKKFEFAQGRCFHPRKFEGIIGSEVAEKTGLKMGDKFKAWHGTDFNPNGEQHHEEWSVVGILKETGTANDHCLFIPLITALEIPEHQQVMKEIATVNPATTPSTAPADDEEPPFIQNPDGTIDIGLPKTEWRVAAIYVRTQGVVGEKLEFAVNNSGQGLMAAHPAKEMRMFLVTFLKPASTVLLIITCLVMVMAAVSILVSIYNAVTARTREIAIMRALGATRVNILMLICAEAGAVGLIGSLAGALIGHAAVGIASHFLHNLLGEGAPWMSVGGFELLYLAAVVLLSLLAGLVPALKAYRTPVATNLVIV